jgi:hypothetical protein
MAVETHRSFAFSDLGDRGLRTLRQIGGGLRRLLENLESWFPFTSLTRRIIFLNLFGLTLLVSGILFSTSSAPA